MIEVVKCPLCGGEYVSYSFIPGDKLACPLCRRGGK